MTFTDPANAQIVSPYDPAAPQPPAIGAKFVPQHVAIVMDGNGRWANERGLNRTEGHRQGEPALLDVVAGALQLGVRYLSVYAFSTENWKRSPEEVRFLMGFNKDVLRRRRDILDSWGVRVRWSGRTPKLWKSVIKELRVAEERTAHNDTLDLVMCVNYGGRAELRDAMVALAADAAAGTVRPEKITEKTIGRYLNQPDVPDVDLFIRTSGEQRLSNFLTWQSAYAELVFVDTLWPDMRREHLWQACLEYAGRDRRFGGAVDTPDSAHGSGAQSPPETARSASGS